jgi:hypothetical protein
MNVNPGQEPSSGPNYFNFDGQVRCAFRRSQVCCTMPSRVTACRAQAHAVAIRSTDYAALD